MKDHKHEYNAKAIEIGKVKDSDSYYLDVISQGGNKQTVRAGTLEEVTEYIKYIKLY